MSHSCRGWKGAKYQADILSLSTACFLHFTYSYFHIVAYSPAEQHVDATVFRNGAEEFSISEVLENETHRSLRRWPWEVLQWHQWMPLPNNLCHQKAVGGEFLQRWEFQLLPRLPPFKQGKLPLMWNKKKSTWEKYLRNLCLRNTYQPESRLEEGHRNVSRDGTFPTRRSWELRMFSLETRRLQGDRGLSVAKGEL